MTPQEDSNSHMEGNLPNSNECRQTEVMNETYVSDAVFSFVGKMPIILDEGELLSPFSSVPTNSAPPQPTAGEESNEDISADSQI